MSTEDTRTREALLGSALWATETAKCDVLKLEVLQFGGWQQSTHDAVRAWAQGGGEMPGVLKTYLEAAR